ncbi:tetratricopeptide repeat-containing sensor histidine kinase [Adhaeribacter rhizoryzae]|uniref:histidine kinase n=1 Tax=Adhaeribacter rhizoryzae TaxID=2607907 RepID=A0A5M6DIA7_9BACT|nr:ATP-binding protein [Adhaeribacter rhizoryzae]KAA5545015.1 tetratricopeptide repeat protein [Adhaeribacter rhizoryzae]
MRKILFLLMFIWASVAQAQQAKTDSLLAALDNAQSDSVKVELQCAISKEYYLSDIDKGLAYASVAEALATKANLLPGKAKALNLIGYAHLVRGEFDQAMQLHYQALNIGEKTADTAILITAYNSLGSLYHKTKDPKRAVSNYNRSLWLAQATHDQVGISKVYNNLGNIYEEEKQYTKALAYFNKAAQIQEKLNNKRSLIISLQNIGTVYLNLPKPEQGLPYLFRSLKLADEIGNKIGKPGVLKSIAQIYQTIGNNAKALQYAQQSYDWALETKSSKKIAASAELLQTLFVANKNYAQAHKYLTVFVEHDNQLDLESQKRTAAELATRYETEKKEIENINLKAEQRRQAHEIKQQQITLLFGVILVAIMLFLLLLFYRSRIRLKAASLKLQEANRLLQSQHTEISRQKNALADQTLKLQEQNEQLEKHHQFKNKIFSIISHDLRTPFGSIKGVLDLVQSHHLPAEEVQPVFKLLSKDVDLTMNMLHNLLIWSRAQIAEKNIALQPINLQQLAQENIELAASQAKQKNISIVNKVDEQAVALADKEQLNFVLRNLLMNAVKFTFEGGEIKVSAGEATDDNITLVVSDNGKGISQANLTKLFTKDRFTTLGTAREKGTGLGLMLSKEFIESLQGTLVIKSTEGVGSTFVVTLPRAVTVPLPEPKLTMQVA